VAEIFNKINRDYDFAINPKRRVFASRLKPQSRASLKPVLANCRGI
jgi:hypothetical protein